jgi:hypothetical protein
MLANMDFACVFSFSISLLHLIKSSIVLLRSAMVSCKASLLAASFSSSSCESVAIKLQRENQPLVEYLPLSSPTKCIACSLDTFRGALYPIIFICFASWPSYHPPKVVVMLCVYCSDCCVVSNGFFCRSFYMPGGICVRKK